ncbi:hypothetical protein UlMin_025300 [Ulmus minor]
MAVSAFKSSSKRSNLTSASSSYTTTTSAKQNVGDSPKKAPIRRSRSVSAFSRTNLDASSSADDFLNKRDNPLFWANASPPGIGSTEPKKLILGNSKSASSVAADDRRGRSVARNSDVSGGRKEVGRSLSRVDTGRRNRSVSRNPISRGTYVNSESEAEQDSSSLSGIRNRRNSNLEVGSGQNKKGLSRSSSDMEDQLKGLRTWSSQHSPSVETSDGSALKLSHSHPTTWEDGVSTGSLLGVEEKTIKAVCEQMKSSDRGDSLGGDATASGIYETVRSEVRRAISEIQNDLESAIQRSNIPAIATTNIADIPPDLVNPSAVELVLDIRREYAKKLEQSEERARRLRSDLAVEEHRGLELSRILKEVLPDPKSSNVTKSRPGRKASIERRKISKRLTEEAMAYFDECVSLSTFDSSDFSSPEDPPLNIVGGTTPVGNGVFSLQASSGVSATDSSSSCFKDKQELGTREQFPNGNYGAELMTSSSHNELIQDQSPSSVNAARDLKSHFSFARRPPETPELQHDIQKYIRNSEKDIKKGGNNLQITRSNNYKYDLEEYTFQAAAQSFVFDRVVMRNRIESGSLLLCNGGIPIFYSSFSSFI